MKNPCDVFFQCCTKFTLRWYKANLTELSIFLQFYVFSFRRDLPWDTSAWKLCYEWCITVMLICWKTCWKSIRFQGKNFVHVSILQCLHRIFFCSLISGILNSQDLKTVVVALQLTRVLIDKQPDVFVVHFKREGVCSSQLSFLNIDFYIILK